MTQCYGAWMGNFELRLGDILALRNEKLVHSGLLWTQNGGKWMCGESLGCGAERTNTPDGENDGEAWVCRKTRGGEGSKVCGERDAVTRMRGEKSDKTESDPSSTSKGSPPWI